MFRNRKGFTLMEMVVATAIFGIVITIYVGIYVASVKVNSKMIANQKVQNEIRYVMELMSREMRLGSINYSYYQQIQDPVSVLAIKDNADNGVYFRANNGYLQISYNASTWANVSTPNVKINELDFFLIPKQDPFVLGSTDKRQQGALIYMDANYNKDGQMDGRIKLQTFTSSRQYKQ